MRFTFYCKTFAPDFDRVSVLIESYKKYVNKDIPFVFSMPQADTASFNNNFGSQDFTIVCDEEFADYTGSDLTGWQQQQVCKLMFWKLNLSDVYHCIDSDMEFIATVDRKDFFGDNNEPMLVATSLFSKFQIGNKTLKKLLFSDQRTWPDFNPDSFPGAGTIDFSQFSYLIAERGNHTPLEKLNNIRKAFGLNYHQRLNYMPGANLIKDVLVSLDNLIKEHSLSFSDLIRICPWEYHWHAEWCLATRCTPFKVTESKFLHFASDGELLRAVALGLTKELIAKQFKGIQLAARHQKALRFSEVAAKIS